MISRELNLVSFNSQTQLNKDWLVSNNDNNEFQNVLETKKEAIAKEVKADEPNEGNERQLVQRESDTPIRRDEDTPEVQQLRKKLKEVLGKKQLTENEETVLTDEELEAIKESLFAELLVAEQQEPLEMLAELLGITVESLMEQLTEENTDLEALATEIVELISEDVNVAETVVKGLREIFVKLDAEEKVAFEEFVSEITKQLPEGEVKDMLTKFETAVQTVNENQSNEVPKVFTENEESEFSVKSGDTLKNPDTEKVAVADSNLSGDQPQKEETDSKTPLAKVSAKVAESSIGEKNLDIQDQIAIMKQGGTDVIVEKASPKEILTKSVMNQVVQGTKMSINMSDNGSEILVKLNPKNLGNVALKMAFDKGQLVAQIQVENQTVKSIIETNLDDLRGALKEEGYEVGELDVSVTKDDTQEERHQQHTFGQNQRNVTMETFEEIEEKILQQKASREGIDYLA